MMNVLLKDPSYKLSAYRNSGLYPSYWIDRAWAFGTKKQSLDTNPPGDVPFFLQLQSESSNFKRPQLNVNADLVLPCHLQAL